MEKKRKSRERENKTKIPPKAVARQKVTGSSRHRSATDHCLSLRTPFVKCRIIPSNSFFVEFFSSLPKGPFPILFASSSSRPVGLSATRSHCHLPVFTRTAICRCSRALHSDGMSIDSGESSADSRGFTSAAGQQRTEQRSARSCR